MMCGPSCLDEFDRIFFKRYDTFLWPKCGCRDESGLHFWLFVKNVYVRHLYIESLRYSASDFNAISNRSDLKSVLVEMRR